MQITVLLTKNSEWGRHLIVSLAAFDNADVPVQQCHERSKTGGLNLPLEGQQIPHYLCTVQYCKHEDVPRDGEGGRRKLASMLQT
jgi:hypothetical protein